MNDRKQTKPFQAEVNQVLSIVVNSLYSNKEIFLRELISNASDALDKLSFRALTEHGLIKGEELTIDLIPSKADGTLTIRDNGIGMTREEAIEHLGTIAKSGSKAMMEALSGDKQKDLSLIGQFGVGFYSAFLVADRVTVSTRPADGGPATVWESEAKGEFTVDDGDRGSRGTDVILHVKEDERDYLDEWTLRSLVRKYSDYVRYPIRLQVERQKGDDPKSTEKELKWETVNAASALWTRPKSEIEPEQYEEFYKHQSHDFDAPLAWTHFKVEGTHELTGLLFLPARRPFDFLERRARGLRLFSKRVFIMEDCEEILPEWLRFVRGVVDSQDLPLNVSRELLQQDTATQFIRKQVITRTLTLLEELMAEGETTTTDADGKEKKRNRYRELWTSFGAVIKEGVHLDPTYRDRLANLLLFHSTHGDELTSLTDYVGRMQPDQPGILYLTAASLATARHSPHLEALRQRGYEVLLMVDGIDEWVVQSLREFEGKKLVAAAKGASQVPASEEAKKEQEEQQNRLAGLLEKMHSALGEQVQEVRVTNRLTDSPACLVTDEQGLSPHLERTLRAFGQDVPPQKRILEVNPEHPVISELQRLADDPARAEDFARWSSLVFDQALIAEGCLPDDPARLARSIAQLMKSAAGGAAKD
jgi:molecular chaperone HtpG